MKTEAAILWERGADWSVEEIELDEPKAGEVLVRMVASGLCASDAHLISGDLPSALPIVGGHEGAGVVEAIGDGVESVKLGDHVLFSVTPSCGRCLSCTTGHQIQCDTVSRLVGSGMQISDQTSRHHARGEDLALMCLLGTFARHSVVSERQCIPIDTSVPLDVACLVGCSVITGYGSVIYAGDVQPGDDVAVIGVGGVGINAVQSARLAGARRIIAIDPIASKRELAREYGATDVSDSIESAYELVKTVTGGRMCKRVIVTMDVARGDLIAPIMRITGKMGRVVLTSLAPAGAHPVSVNLFDLTMREKEIVGSLSGSGNPQSDLPKLIGLMQAGRLEVADQITRTYPLTEINQGFRDTKEGKNLRAVLLCE